MVFLNELPKRRRPLIRQMLDGREMKFISKSARYFGVSSGYYYRGPQEADNEGDAAMLQQLKGWLRNRKQPERRPTTRRTILYVEWLEARVLLAGDIYTWNPGNVNLLANNPANWMIQIGGINVQQGANGTLPGNNANDIAILDGPTSQKNIEWNKNFSFSTLTVQGGYIGDQTIDSGVTVDLTGVNGNNSLNAGGPAGLITVKWADNTSVLEIDNNATIAAFTFMPVGLAGSGVLKITAGTTNICTGTLKTDSTFWGTIDVTNINEGSTITTLEHKGQTQLELSGPNTTIQISPYAVFQVDGGAGKTLIAESKAGSNDYIWVNGGELKYQGKAGASDTFTAPVLVGNGGVFSLDGGGGGALTITGQEQGTNNYSLYSTGSIYLSNSMNLQTPTGSNCTSTSVVSTLDSSTDTITVASGNPLIIDGSLQIDTESGTYGKLVINCDTLNFGGTLIVHLSGPNDGECDELVVNGALDLDPNGSQLDPVVDGDTSNSNGYSWTVVTASGGIENYFSYVYPTNPNLHWQQSTDSFTEIYGYA